MNSQGGTSHKVTGVLVTRTIGLIVEAEPEKSKEDSSFGAILGGLFLLVVGCAVAPGLVGLVILMIILFGGGTPKKGENHD